MDIKNRIERVSNALLCMQRNSWEQGVAAQAFIELGKKDFVILMAREAIIRQLKDGRLGVMGNATAATDPAANGESVLYAYKITKDIDFKKAFQMMVDWILSKTPRSKDDIIYHFTDKSQIWVDSLYMAPPCLSIAGYYDEAIKQIDGYRKKLYDNEKKLYSHIWDDDLNDYIRKDFWGVGNGWALAGITRVIKHLPIEMDDEKKS